MAHTQALLAVLALLVAAASAASAPDVNATSELHALPAQLQQEWTARIAKQARALEAAEIGLGVTLEGEAKAAVRRAADWLHDFTDPKNQADLTAFAALFIKQVSQAIEDRLEAAKSDKNDPQAVKKKTEADELVGSWRPQLNATLRNATQNYKDTIDNLSYRITKETSTKKAIGQVRLEIVRAGKIFLSALDAEHLADVALLNRQATQVKTALDKL